MTQLAWIAIILWGAFLTGLGLLWSPMPEHDVLFMVAGGLFSGLVGTLGLMGRVTWVPNLRNEQKNYS